MRAGVMSASLLGMAEDRRKASKEQAAPARTRVQSIDSWDSEKFAREQIRRLVRQVFLSSTPSPARQVVFSAIEAEVDISHICVRIGEVLAMETSADIAVLFAWPGDLSAVEGYVEDTRNEPANGSPSLRKMMTRLKRNLWLGSHDIAQEGQSFPSLQDFFRDVRREFEYSIVRTQPADEWSTAEIAQASDGLILVVSAQRTRRVSALRIKQMLEDAKVRILGVVLNDREFPIPERIYRRL